jgi:hypothetical protein
MDRLLEKPIQNGRYAQHACASSGFGDVHPPHGTGFITAAEDLLFDPVPVFQQVSAELARLHAVHSGGTGITFHRLQGSEQVVSFEHRFDEVRLSGIGLILASRRVCAADRHSSQLPAATVQVNFGYLNRLFWRCFSHRESRVPFLSFCSTLQRGARLLWPLLTSPAASSWPCDRASFIAPPEISPGIAH